MKAIFARAYGKGETEKAGKVRLAFITKAARRYKVSEATIVRQALDLMMTMEKV